MHVSLLVKGGAYDEDLVVCSATHFKNKLKGAMNL